MSRNRPAGFVYMLRCADGAYYIGSHRGDDPAKRVWEHNEGIHPHAYTFTRRPVELVWSEWFDRYDEIIARERQIKGWSRAKKEALIRMDGGALVDLSRRGARPDPSRRIDHLAMIDPPQDEGPCDQGLHSGEPGKARSPRSEEPREAKCPHPEEPREARRLEGWTMGAHDPSRRDLAAAPQDEENR